MRFLSKIPTYVSLIFISLLVFTATGFAADAVLDATAPQSSLLDLLKPVYNAFAGGHYAYAAALAVIVMVALVKRYLGGSIPWLHTDLGGSAMALIASSATAVSAGLAAPGAVVSFGLMKTALLVGIGAAGGFAMIKNLIIEPLLKPLEAKAPAWMRPIFGMIGWIFDKPDAVQTAEKAGVAAVAATPAVGLSASTGTPTDVK